MKKFFLIITLSLVGATAIFSPPGDSFVAYAQKDKKDDKKDKPGPPVVRPKEKQERPKEPPPKKDKKP
jgi:uncharacterized alpha/beta hydrolase family protein